jgi:YfiH family protein
MLEHPLLAVRGIAHGFGVRGAAAPAGLLRPRQVHGRAIVTAAACREQPPPAADGVVSAEPGVAVGVVTADCLPVLLASGGGEVVAAIHAGWRGLASGVVGHGVDALRRSSGSARIVAAIGPHIGACCYEVDAPVIDALSATFGAIDDALRPTRPGHALLDLFALAERALALAGVARDAVGRLPDACTRCDPLRFHSYRRDGARAGRLVHFIAAAQA